MLTINSDVDSKESDYSKTLINYLILQTHKIKSYSKRINNLSIRRKPHYVGKRAPGYIPENCCIRFITAGPKRTTNIEGSINKTNGMTIFTEASAASFSAF